MQARHLVGLALAAGRAADAGRPTPAEIQAFLEATLACRFDTERYGRSGYFASPEETRARRAGDCVDWAWLAGRLPDAAGYGTVRFSVRRPVRDPGGNDGVGGAWDHMSTLGYVRARAATLEALAASVFPDWTRADSWRYEGPAATRNGWNGWVPTLRTLRGTLRGTAVASAPRGTLPAPWGAAGAAPGRTAAAAARAASTGARRAPVGGAP